MTGPVWSASGVTVKPILEHTPDYGLVVGVLYRSGTLQPELVRSLRDWLTWYLHDGGESPPPADPDAVRVAVDEARAALSERSAEPVSEDFRAGLAWVDHWLDVIHHTAGGTR